MQHNKTPIHMKRAILFLSLWAAAPPLLHAGKIFGADTGLPYLLHRENASSIVLEKPSPPPRWESVSRALHYRKIFSGQRYTLSGRLGILAIWYVFLNLETVLPYNV